MDPNILEKTSSKMERKLNNEKICISRRSTISTKVNPSHSSSPNMFNTGSKDSNMDTSPILKYNGSYLFKSMDYNMKPPLKTNPNPKKMMKFKIAKKSIKKIGNPNLISPNKFQPPKMNPKLHNPNFNKNNGPNNNIIPPKINGNNVNNTVKNNAINNVGNGVNNNNVDINNIKTIRHSKTIGSINDPNVSNNLKINVLKKRPLPHPVKRNSLLPKDWSMGEFSSILANRIEERKDIKDEGFYRNDERLMKKEELSVMIYVIGSPPISFGDSINLPTNKFVFQISSGTNFFLILTNEKEIYSYGSNVNGELGIGNMVKESKSLQLVPKLENKNIVKIYASYSQSAALDKEGILYMWGRSEISMENLYFPKDMSTIVNADGPQRLRDISLGKTHMMALNDKKEVLMWGINHNYCLGISKHSLNEKVITPQHLPFFEAITSVYAGDNCSAMISAKGKVYFWGRNFCKDYTSLTRDSDFKRTSAIEDILFPRLLNPHHSTKKETYFKVSLGYNHLTALSLEGNVYTMGENKMGQLGVEKNMLYSEIFESVSVRNGENCKIVDISCGDYHTVALTDRGKIFTWGKNLVVEGKRTTESVNYLPTKVEKFESLNILLDKVISGNGYALCVDGLKNFPNLKFKSFDPVVVHLGNFESLTNWLLHPKRCEHLFGADDFMQHFLIVFPTFTSPINLLQVLSKKFFESSFDNDTFKMKKILKIFQEWIILRNHGNFSEFSDPTFSSFFYSFIEKIQLQSKHSGSQKLKSLYSSQVTKPKLPMFQRYHINFSALMQSGPEYFAQQLTLADSTYVSLISRTEFFETNWLKKNNAETAPNIIQATEHFNRVCNWVKTIIVCSKAEERSSKASFFVQLANECVKLSNFFSAVSIMAAFNSAVLTKLINKGSVKLSEEENKTLASIDDLVFTKNASEYRSLIKKSILDGKPFIPYIGITLTDLTFEENKPDTINGLINFFKLERIAKSIHLVLQCQKLLTHYYSSFDKFSNYQMYIHHNLPIVDDESLERVLNN